MLTLKCTKKVRDLLGLKKSDLADLEDNICSRYTKTDSRKLLGNLNDLVFLYEHMIWDQGGLDYCNLSDLFLKINRTPQRSLDWRYSIDATKDLLGLPSDSHKSLLDRINAAEQVAGAQIIPFETLKARLAERNKTS